MTKPLGNGTSFESMKLDRKLARAGPHGKTGKAEKAFQKAAGARLSC